MAAVTETSICNIALIKIGAERISNLTQDKKEAKLCNRLYAPSRDMLLRLHPWNFAIERAELAQLDDVPIADYSYQYQLPTNPECLRILEVTESLSKWVVEGDYLLIDDGAVEIRYIKRVIDPTKFDTGFVELLADKLASDLAIPITHNLRLAGLMKAEYRSSLIRIRGMDYMEEEKESDEPDLWTD